jgi:hypothetical protein
VLSGERENAGKIPAVWRVPGDDRPRKGPNEDADRSSPTSAPITFFPAGLDFTCNKLEFPRLKTQYSRHSRMRERAFNVWIVTWSEESRPERRDRHRAHQGCRGAADSKCSFSSSPKGVRQSLTEN